MERTLIRDGLVVSMDDQIGIVEHCDVLIVDGAIEHVGPNLPVEDCDQIDASGTIVLPGFIDTHRHLWQTPLRGLLPACSLGAYFQTVMGTYAPAFRAQDVYAGNLAGAAEAINAGITTVVDWCHCLNTPDHADAAIGALRETGIRSMFGYGWPGGFQWLMNSTLGHPQDARRVRSQHFASGDQLLTFALALRGPATLSPTLNRSDFQLARELDARITVHVGMRITGITVREIATLGDDGLLGPDTTFVHCNQTPNDDLRAIAESGGTVSISPYVEMVMGHGAPPTGRLLECGLRPTLSVDTTTTVPGDMFTQMRFALAQERIRALPDDIEADFAPELTAMDVLRFATIDGATACGLEHRAGSLTPGKRADITLIRADGINTMPATDPIGTVVTSADTSNVDTVLVDGRVLKRRGVLTGLSVARIGELARQARDHVLAAAEAQQPAMH